MVIVMMPDGAGAGDDGEVSVTGRRCAPLSHQTDDDDGDGDDDDDDDADGGDDDDGGGVDGDVFSYWEESCTTTTPR